MEAHSMLVSCFVLQLEQIVRTVTAVAIITAARYYYGRMLQVNSNGIDAALSRGNNS